MKLMVIDSEAGEASLPGAAKTIRAFIVDDELLARAKIRSLLAPEPDLEVVGESDNGPEAVAFIREHRPDVVFLDVQMPSMSGLDVVRALPPDRRPLTIFVTAYERHALEAFEVHAVDYLLKPVSALRFAEALQRARQCLAARCSETIARNGTAIPTVHPPGQITVKTAHRTVFIPVQAIDYIESAANYAILHAGTETHIVRDTLTSLMRKLPGDAFVRISRGGIVKVTSIAEVRQPSRRHSVAVLKNGKGMRMTCGVREICRRM